MEKYFVTCIVHLGWNLDHHHLDHRSPKHTQHPDLEKISPCPQPHEVKMLQLHSWHVCRLANRYLVAGDGKLNARTAAKPTAHE